MRYCDIESVKDRLLIKEDDDTWDIPLEKAIEEASSIVDIFLKPYEEVPLASFHAVPNRGKYCLLMKYVMNDTRIFAGVEQDITPVELKNINDVIFYAKGDGITPINVVAVFYFDNYPNNAIVTFDLSGVTSWTECVWTGLYNLKVQYPTVKLTKIRLVVFNGPTKPCEVNVYVDDVMVPAFREYVMNGGFETGSLKHWQHGYLTEDDSVTDSGFRSGVYNFIAGETALTKQLKDITADFAASVFKRRWIPEEVKVRGTLQPDMINDVDGTGWFAIGLKKLQEYIKSFYALTTPAKSQEGYVNNMDAVLSLFKQGILTLKEARQYLSDDSMAMKEYKINNIVNTTVDNSTEEKASFRDETLYFSKEEENIINKTENLETVKNLVDTSTKNEVVNLQENNTAVLDRTETQHLNREEIQHLNKEVTQRLDREETQRLNIEEENLANIKLDIEEKDVLDKQETITSTLEDTKIMYHINKQKSFAFIESNPYSKSYRIQRNA